jgi:hypothetical protein
MLAELDVHGLRGCNIYGRGWTISSVTCATCNLDTLCVLPAPAAGCTLLLASIRQLRHPR